MKNIRVIVLWALYYAAVLVPTLLSCIYMPEYRSITEYSAIPGAAAFFSLAFGYFHLEAISMRNRDLERSIYKFCYHKFEHGTGFYNEFPDLYEGEPENQTLLFTSRLVLPLCVPPFLFFTNGAKGFLGLLLLLLPSLVTCTKLLLLAKKEYKAHQSQREAERLEQERREEELDWNDYRK